MGELDTHLLSEHRYTAKGTFVAAHGCVAPKGRAILPRTTTNTPFTVFI